MRLMSDYQYYSTINPTDGELVLVEFTERLDSFFDAKLIEYPYRGMMNYSDASKKRKISSWNKIVPLNKLMVARVDNVDENAKIVSLSIAYLDEYCDEKNLSPADIQNKLIANFNENKYLERLIMSFCKITDQKLDDVWTTFVHIVDTERRLFNDETEDIPLSLWKYFTEKYDENIDTWCSQSEFNEENKNALKALYIKRTEKGPQKITSNIKIISQEGVSSTKKLLEKCLKSIKYEYTFRYSGAPNFVFETSTTDTSQEDHHELIKNLKAEIQKLKLTFVFVQALPEETAKISE